MIRIVILDDHPAVRLGLASALRSEPGLLPVGDAQQPDELAPLLYRTRPDVVLLDYHLPRRDGLSLCCEIKSDALAPAVLLYSAYADDSLVVPAIIAGADGILPKSAPSLQLFETIRVMADGGTALPPLSADLLKIAGGLLDPEDVPILGMLVSRTARRDIANALQLNPDALARRIARMLNRLKAHVGPAKKPITTTR
jgi:DNA-binding NarL/FixJ family response regulator